jgi:superfamily II DNA or RNA helicase
MALRLDPVRLLIGDDVGIGKTVEAALVVKELIARGEADRVCILCPPHLAEQWKVELKDKFSLDAALVLPSTIARLEREVPRNQSVFEHYPVTIVSLDYIKQASRRDDFIRTCPDLVIVDEAHTCTQAPQGAQQQRYQLLKRLSENPKRHMLLVTATPHSGNEDAFRSLLSILKPEFADLPEDLRGEQNRQHRERLAAHFVQRRRGDIQTNFIEDTPFPKREEKDETYKLHPDYKAFLNRALAYAREVVQDGSGTRFQQRIRWWSALAMLRSISSSPAAAAATLRARANVADGENEGEVELLGKRSVMDLTDAEAVEAFDVTPGADAEPGDTPGRRRLLDLARAADGLRGDKDRKLIGLAESVKKLLAEGYSPIVFCRYIATAEYVAEEFAKRLKGVEVACVTGQLPHDEREVRVAELAEKDRRVLVCTDCLSEGINLQQSFDAVLHADLAWSPTRHEQREGRVDRFNQRSPKVRVVTYYGSDNPIDGIVLEILLKRHRAIRNDLGISVPVPVDTDKVVEAMLEAVLLKSSSAPEQLALFDDVDLPQRNVMNREWEEAKEREKRSRTLFAQHSIKAAEVQPELDEVRGALGSPSDLERFVREAIASYGGHLEPKSAFAIDLRQAPLALRDAIVDKAPAKASFAVPPAKGAETLTRTHPFVESLAAFVMDAALAEDEISKASRCSVTATDSVAEMTTLLLLRFRYQIGSAKSEMLAEDVATVAFRGAPDQPTWLAPDQAEAMLAARATSNLPPEHSRQFLNVVLSTMPALAKPLRELAEMRADKVLAAHRRVRKAIDSSHAARDVKVQGEPDVLGLFILIPGGAST